VNAPVTTKIVDDVALHNAIASAIETIAPSWPLDRMIAVNPYWGRIQQTFEEAAAALSTVAGSPLTLPFEHYREAWRNGEITGLDLQQALTESGTGLTPERLIAALDRKYPAPVPVPLLSDLLDRQRNLQREPSWCDSITHQVSQFCAAYFDRDQANWHPDQAGRLYASWRKSLVLDHSIPLLMQAPYISVRARALARDPVQQIADSLARLELPVRDWAIYLQAVLMRVSGWAAWCAYLRWQARLEDRSDETLVDLLAVRLSWETLLDDGVRCADSPWLAWHGRWQQQERHIEDAATQLHHIWLRAQELSYQRSLVDRLRTAPAVEMIGQPAVQAAFCIDVRSEVLRRQLEARAPDIQTLGFAGFFGLPVSYAPMGTPARRPQLPGLLAPTLDITDSTGNPALDAGITRGRARRLRGMHGWRTFESVPLSTFALVEALGLVYLGKLVKRSLPGNTPFTSNDSLGLDAIQARTVRPVLDEATAGGVAGQANIAAQVLGAMGLKDKFARLVLLIGHGSQNRNNPHRAGLDCGACCGQTGEVNARALAGLLNSPSVRLQLRHSGIQIPDSTHFVAGLHNTTTDEVLLFDLDELPASHAGDAQHINSLLTAAGASARRERAHALGLGALEHKPEPLLRAVRARADDWAQTRPEWGLANNASFIVAPRSRTRGVDLEGRSFLHDYDHRKDADGSLLELIMTAPMIVTNWINMQYFASTVDNKRYGSGNKTLHNVVDGRIGVFEGNGGDLRIGLPWQSLHDGERWLHTPLRLTVVIEAPRAAIDRVIARHENVRQLVHNRWLYLMRLDGDQIEIYRDRRWQLLPR
jgi:uncharacterized protein YbcC (UPF0753/DUF2309 family)